MKTSRPRGRPPKGDAPLTQADRSRSARARRAAERSSRTRALAAALRDLTVDATDPATNDLISALGEALVGVCLDVHQGPGEAGEDAGIRAAVRAYHAALTATFECAAAARGAMMHALDEVMTETA